LISTIFKFRSNLRVFFVTIIAVLILGLSVPPVIAADANKEEPVESEVDTYEKLKVFSEILALLEANYVEEVESDDLVNGAIRGMLKTLDPHTTYLPPKSYQQMKVDTSGKFGGLGIEISIRKGVLTVVSPIEGTPAYNMGIKPGDKIIMIEKESTLDFTLQEAVSMLRGERGTSVNITVFREGVKTPLEFSIKRDIINVKSVKKKLYPNNIGYIQIKSFTRSTSSDLDKALADFSAKRVSKLVLDLRNNPGGLLNQAVEVSDRFLSVENLIVYTQGRTEDQNMRFTTHDSTNQVDFPMIILVNGGSASASEIVAGALQDLGRAVILGSQTFGKGSVQTIIPLSDGSALRMTTARYYTPSGKVIQERGITPDIIVEAEKAPLEAELTEDEKIAKNEKDKFRRILREKDLKKHLKGKAADGLTPEEDAEEPKDKSIDAELVFQTEDLKNDNQLRQAIALLDGWEIIGSVYSIKKKDSVVK
jgi:carboxyl-terminal processing protease